MLTPDEIREAMIAVRAELRRAPDVIEKLELEFEGSQLAAETAADVAFLEANGNVEERKAASRLSARKERDVAVIHKAAYNRAKLKVRMLETELMSLQSLLKSIQLDGA